MAPSQKSSGSSSCSGGGFVAEKQSSGTSNAMRSVFFNDVGTGWAGGEKETLLWTGDSGRTWTVVKSGGDGSFDDVHFASKNVGVIAATAGWGWDPDPAYSGSKHIIAKGSNKSDLLRNYSTFLITEDGGATWKKSFVPTNFVMSSVRFLDRQTGWFTSYGSEGHDDSDMWVTRDGGKSFQQWRNSGCWCFWHDSELVDPQRWIVTGENFMYTEDGGLNFKAAATPAWMKLKGISFADSSRGWAVGDAGKIVSTTDGGATWREQNSSVQADLRAVHFTSSTDGWAVGRGGTILRTTDAGVTWSAFGSGTTSDLEEVHFPAPCFGWVVGAGGLIMLLRDGTPPPQGGLARIEIAPAASSITADQTAQFTAKGYDTNGTPVPISPSWSATGGAVDPNGLYSPGPTGKFQVTARVGSVQAGATVTVRAGELATVEVSPGSATLSLGHTQAFTASGSDSRGNPVPVSPTWGANGGSIDGSGLYTATKSGQFTVKATDGPASGDAAVTVLAGPPVSLEVRPASATVRADETVTFAAVGLDAEGNPVALAAVWSLEGSPPSGSISTSGTLTPGKAGDYRIVASASGLTGTAGVKVIAGKLASASVSPASANLKIGETASFTASVEDSNGNRIDRPAVRWSVQGGLGTISTEGVLTADEAGSGSVVAEISDGSVTLTAEAAVTVAGSKPPVGPVHPPGPLVGGPGLVHLGIVIAILSAIATAAGGVHLMRRRRPATCPTCRNEHTSSTPCYYQVWR